MRAYLLLLTYNPVDFQYYLSERTSLKFGDLTLNVPVDTGVTIAFLTSGAVSVLSQHCSLPC